VAEKEGELTVAPELLAQVKLVGRVVTGDALYAQKNLSHQVVEQGGDYFWVVKDNQPTLRADIALLFAAPPWGEEFATVTEQGRHGDRQEVRKLWASTALNEYLDWPQVQQVCCVERRVTRKGVTREETAYAITSLSPKKADALRLLQVWRGHWGIENRLHYVRDVTMKEDASQVRSGSAPEVMAALRNVVLGLLRQAGATNIAAALRHYSYKPMEALALLGVPLP
jgi:predicted transposase YbfD/YdcC